jgi:riboflavin kinase/FMN adenylyltransferase
VVGYDHAFGHDRKGDSGFLSRLADKTGIEVIKVQPIVENELPISSTKIREKILNGNCEEAARLLGRPYKLSGIVEKGCGRGHSIGYPTANIILPVIKPIPCNGVYAVKVYINEKTLGGMMSIGENLTFGETKKTMEVNIFDFCEDIYGKEISVELISQIRDMQKFSNADELINNLREDERKTREILTKF